MKSLILKDLYNVGHNIKSLIFILVIYAVIFIPSSSVESYIVLCTVLCSTMILTSFSFDEACKWTRYAMIMPISKKELVRSKFILLLIFSATGIFFGLVFGIIGGLIVQKFVFTLETIGGLLAVALVSLVMSELFGGLSILLTFKFGTEKARILLIVSYLIPALLLLGIYKLFSMLGIVFTEQLIFILLCCSPVVIVGLIYLLYRSSCFVFSKKEF